MNTWVVLDTYKDTHWFVVISYFLVKVDVEDKSQLSTNSWAVWLVTSYNIWDNSCHSLRRETEFCFL